MNYTDQNKFPLLFLDFVSAVPSIGIRYTPIYKSTDFYIQMLEPFFKKHTKTEIATQIPMFSLYFRIPDKGLFVNIDNGNIVFRIKYESELITNETGMLENVTTPEPSSYQTLLQDCMTTAKQIIKCIQKKQEFSINRFGVVAECCIPNNLSPPGIKTMLQPIKKELGNDTELTIIRFRRKIATYNDGWEQYHFQVDKSEKDDSICDLKLDWQRYFEPDFLLSSENTEDIFNQMEGNALSCFNVIGTGDSNEKK